MERYDLLPELLRLAEAGPFDQELDRRLQEIDRATRTLISRLPPEQTLAIINTCLRIIQDQPFLDRKGQPDCPAVLARIEGFLYGFQMAHDYVVRHGPLLKED